MHQQETKLWNFETIKQNQFCGHSSCEPRELPLFSVTKNLWNRHIAVIGSIGNLYQFIHDLAKKILGNVHISENWPRMAHFSTFRERNGRKCVLKIFGTKCCKMRHFCLVFVHCGDLHDLATKTDTWEMCNDE